MLLGFFTYSLDLVMISFEVLVHSLVDTSSFLFFRKKTTSTFIIFHSDPWSPRSVSISTFSNWCSTLKNHHIFFHPLMKCAKDVTKFINCNKILLNFWCKINEWTEESFFFVESFKKLISLMRYRLINCQNK